MYSPDNRYIVASSADETLRIWEAESGLCIKVINTGRFPDSSSIAFSPGGDYLVVSWDLHLFVLETKSWGLINRIDCESGIIYDICFSHDGEVLATASIDKKVRLWDIKTGECKHIYEGHQDRVNCVSFSPDDHFIASGSDDTTVRMREYKSLFLKKEPAGRHVPFYSLRNTKDGAMRLGVYGYRTVCVTDSKTKDKIIECNGHSDDISGLCYSPDESLIASCSYDKTIRIWDSKTGSCLHVLKGHEDVVEGIQFNPNGNLIISWSTDKTVRIWDVSSGQCLQILSNSSRPFDSVAFFTEDGENVVIEHDGDSVSCNFLPLEQLIEQVCSTMSPRQFTKEEKERFYLG